MEVNPILRSNPTEAVSNQGERYKMPASTNLRIQHQRLGSIKPYSTM
ncbi:MAG: hypothetical protein MI922_20385 [Bacteroidales bacterium]|nr:hypothetical protein [Bacteroidales bacterium]